MAGRYVDGNWEEEHVMQQLGQNVGGWTNQGIAPKDMVDPRFQSLLQQIGFDESKHYRFDPTTGYHLYAPEVGNALSGLATQVSQQDKKGGFGNAFQSFFDNGGGVMAMGGIGMGAALGGAFPGMDALTGATFNPGQSGLLSQFGANNPFGNLTGSNGLDEIIGADDFSVQGGPSQTQSFGGDNSLDLGIKGLGESSAQTFGQSFGSAGQGSGLFSATGSAAAGGGSFIDSILSGAKEGLKGVNDALGSNITFGDIAKTGANFLINRSASNDYMDAANQAQQRANPLNDPQRQPYQQQLSQLLSNPSQFYSQNPVVQAQLNLAKQQFEANTGKMGTGGTQFNDYLKNVQNVAAGTFNDQAKLLGDLGGFGMSGAAGGNIYGQLADKGIQQQQQQYTLFPDIMKKIFGGSDNNTQASPSGTNIVSLP